LACALGVLISILTPTGVVIWLKKRDARVVRRQRSHPSPAVRAAPVR
jgi:uncharacterized iron-regulated membrane protein